MKKENSEFYMKTALQEAKKAFDADEIPIGAVIVCNDQIIARAHNMTEKLNDVTAHAEMIAFTSASNYLNSKYLHDCTLYITVEPCLMCAGASYWTQVSKIVYGTPDPKRGYSTCKHTILHPKTKVYKGVLEKECAELMKAFFITKRNLNL
ncbi:MAG: nucleoside deaminase [Bacteroidia bacterium]